ncbi:MAG: hypothetical protein ACJ8F7_18105 [Gemmataceae bacterium]
MAKVNGSFVSLSLPRRMIGDFLSGTRQMPLVTGQRRLRLAEVIAARHAAKPRPSWAALTVKAYAAVCARNSRLRRTFVSWPWSRLFQYDEPIISLVVERDYHGEAGLFLARFHSPHQTPLAELHESIQEFKTRPIEEIRGFHNALRMAALPALVRRPLWWLMMNVMPRLRAGCLGTHGISPTTGMRVRGIHIVTPWTVAMHYDLPGEDGEMDFRFSFDHRVYDAGYLAVAMGAIEQELCGPIVAELRAMAAPHALSRAA